MEKEKRTEISELGKFGLIERLTGGKIGGEAMVMEEACALPSVKTDGNEKEEFSSYRGLKPSGNDVFTLMSSKMLLEGIDFDLTYFPLRHLGYKTVTVGAGGVLAMNGLPVSLTLTLGVSAKLSVEDLDEFFAGVRAACEELGCELAGADVKASVTGLAIGVSVAGKVACGDLVRRDGAHENDLICITRDLGAAYLGLHLLEREKRALSDVANPRPKFEGYEYLLERQLKPRARKDIIDALAAENIVPTAMTEISDGAASDLLQICRASHVGARIYLDRLPIARETYALAEELHIDPVVAALNGGDDHELLFTVPLAMREKVSKLGAGIEIIGHITPESTGTALTTPDGSDIPLKAQGFEKR